MQRIFILILMFLLLVVFQETVAQTDIIDSLEARLPNTNGTERIKTLIHLSEANREYSHDDCINFAIHAADLAKKWKILSLQAYASKSIGVCYLYNGELDLALQFFNQALNLYININDRAGMSNCLNNIGLTYLESGNYTKSAEYYEKNYNMVKESGNRKEMASAIIQLGNINYYRSNFQQSLDNYYQALLIYSDLNDESGMADAYYSLAIIYSELKSFIKALDYYKKAELTYRKTGNKRDLSHVLNNMAKIYNFEYKDFKKAHSLYNQTLELKKELNDKIGIALLFNNLGTLFGNMKEYEEALKYFTKSKAIYQEIESESGMIMVIYNIGQIFQEKGEIQHAITLFKESLEIAKKNNEVSYINQNYEALFHSYVQLCNYEEFNKYYSLFAIGKDTLIDRLNQAEIAEVEAKYKAEELLQEVTNMHKDKEKHSKEIQKYRLLIAGSAGLFLIVLLFCFFLWWKNK